MLLTHEFQERTPNNHRAEPAEIWKARKFIEEHSGEELSLRRVAKTVKINANYFSEKFKQVTGINFVEYVARTRFEKACDLLRNSNLPINEIAFAVGFHRGVDLISDALPFGPLWYDTPDHAIGYAMHYSRSADAVIRVYA